MAGRGSGLVIEFSDIPSTSVHHIPRGPLTPNPPRILSVLIPAMLHFEFTGDSRACHRCKKKWEDDTCGQAAWKVVLASTKKVVDICPECFAYKTEREYRCLSFSPMQAKHMLTDPQRLQEPGRQRRPQADQQ